ncbi:hypothetical protein M0802_005150 [Mischocyttarus mexicanus]|nr:hypothetical protein M0802_005150 [Mischocyttarus mexicanus]
MVQSRLSVGCVKIKKRIVKVLFSEEFQNVASAFSQRKLKLDSKQCYRQIAKGSEKILVYFTHSLVKFCFGCVKLRTADNVHVMGTRFLSQFKEIFSVCLASPIVPRSKERDLIAIQTSILTPYTIRRTAMA